MKSTRRHLQSAFTLIEAMVVVAVVVVILMLAAPSFRELIEMQRLRSTNAQLVTDLQFARAEAPSRQKFVVLKLGASAGADARTCYTIYTCTVANFNCDCDCTRGAGSACVANASTEEVRTVVISGSTGVEVGQPPAPMGSTPEVRFDPRTGGVQVLTANVDSAPTQIPWTGAIDTRLTRNAQITLRTMIGLTGRTSVCAPLGLVSGFSTTCAQN